MHCLDLFAPPVRDWFTSEFGSPTRAQAEGWPAIARGEHTLILSPTGSGKTLAAFLSAIDGIYRQLSAQTEAQSASSPGHRGAPSGTETTRGETPAHEQGIHLVYVSPLKALNNDIQRNLRRPLAGIRTHAERKGRPFPEIRTAVRSGDTPGRDRRAMIKHPPHILITTPESLYLMLTGPRSNELFRPVQTLIVDEIHTLAGNKRGAHLALTLERLEHAAAAPVQRIALSATIRPLEEVASFLGGDRPVTIVDAGHGKPLDLEVSTVVPDFRDLPGGSIWPVLIPRLLRLIEEHRTTLVFANSRRLAERTADRLNEQRNAEERGEASGLVEQGVAKGIGFAALGRGLTSQPIRAHHGSIAKDTRLEMERDLKEGRLRAIVGTSSLELGIDIGSVDLVAQLQSPKSVAQGLQRVGRSGHLVGQTSKGRIFPTHREDLMEAAAVAAGMKRGEVEATHTPVNPLDVLAQQIVAMVAVEDWGVTDLLGVMRRSHPFRNLSETALRSVLAMLSGRYSAKVHRELRPRIAWDRTRDILTALPGSRLAAVSHAGTITDRGAFGAYLPDGRTRIGELDEEFVFETRVGDTFMLGAQVWRVLEVTDDKVLVGEAPGSLPRMPFWRGDMPWRAYELGVRAGAFRRRTAATVRALKEELGLDSHRELRSHKDHPRVAEELARLRSENALDDNSAWLVFDYLAGQLDRGGQVAGDRTVVVELFADALGDPRLVVHSCFGGRVNGPWGLALAAALREHTGVNVEYQTNDDGMLFRFPESDAEFPLELVTSMTAVEARRRVLADLPHSAVFGAQFRQNAARALLLPGVGPGRRTPFWLQRLRARDLLQTVRRLPDFPVLVETYRDCLEDVMDLPHLEEVLEGIERGRITMVAVRPETPSPVAESLLFAFQSIYTYEWDSPRTEQRAGHPAVDMDLLQDVLREVDLGGLLRPEAIAKTQAELDHSHPTRRARTKEELALILDALGDLTLEELARREAVDGAPWLAELMDEGRVVEIEVPRDTVGRGTGATPAPGPRRRIVPRELAAEYRSAWSGGPGEDTARRHVLLRFLDRGGPISEDDIAARYSFPLDWVRQELGRLAGEGYVARLDPSRNVYVKSEALARMHRYTVSMLRHEFKPVPFTAYLDFLTRLQHLHPWHRQCGPKGVSRILDIFEALPLAGQVFLRDVLPLRVSGYEQGGLDLLFEGGDFVWVASGGPGRRLRAKFIRRDHAHLLLATPEGNTETMPAQGAILDALAREGALFYRELRDLTGLTDMLLDSALLDLCAHGLVTNDSPGALRRLISGEAVITERRLRAEPGSLETELEVRLGPLRHRPSRASGRPSRKDYRAAKRRVEERLRGTLPTPWPGRFSLVARLAGRGEAVSETERTVAQARVLLQRWGVVSRDCLEREEERWSWPDLAQELTRMEMRGEVRRGYFVRGLSGIQFALPETLDRLREAAADVVAPLDRVEGRATPVPVVMNACDPADLLAPAPTRDYLRTARDLPHSPRGEQLALTRLASSWLVLHSGLPTLVAEGYGSALSTRRGADEHALSSCLQAFLEHLGDSVSRVVVEEIDGTPVLQSTHSALLHSLGFYRESPVMIWEPGFGGEPRSGAPRPVDEATP